MNRYLTDPRKILTILATAVASTTASQGAHEHHIAAGYSHSLAVKANGQVWAWGDNNVGQLGIGTSPTGSLSPVQAGSFTNAISVAAGNYHSMALTSDKKLYTWGYNDSGVLGNATSTDSYVPVHISALTNVVSIGAGDFHSMAVLANGNLYTWGDNAAGQLGDGLTANRNAPYHVSAISNVVAADGGSHHTIALKANGEVWSWGYNGYGVLGNGTYVDSTTPVQSTTPGLGPAKAIAAGTNHSLLLTTTGEVWAWGVGGAIGDGGTSSCNVPTKITTLSNVVAISAGLNYSLAVTADGKVWGWGDNFAGQLDNSGVDALTPIQISGLSTDGSEVAAGAYHSLEIQQDGDIEAWGSGYNGELGDGLGTSSNVPVTVAGGGGYVSSPVGGALAAWNADNANPTAKTLFASYNFTPVSVGGSLSYSRVNDLTLSARHATARNISKVTTNVLTNSTNGISGHGFGAANAYHFSIDTKSPIIDYRDVKSLSFWFKVASVPPVTANPIPIFSYVPYGALRTAGSSTANQNTIRALMQENPAGTVEVFFRNWESEIYSIRDRWTLDRSAAQLADRWVNLTWVWKGSPNGWFLYLDGRQQTRTSGSLRPLVYNPLGQDTFVVGAQAVTGSGAVPGLALTYFNGTFDRVRLYSSELSAADVVVIRQQDTDGDGIWDVTENKIGGARPYTWDVSITDTDNDGVTDIAEQVAETNVTGP